MRIFYDSIVSIKPRAKVSLILEAIVARDQIMTLECYESKEINVLLVIQAHRNIYV